MDCSCTWSVLRDIRRCWIVTRWSLARLVVLSWACAFWRDCVEVVEMIAVRVWGIPKHFVWWSVCSQVRSPIL